MEIAMTVRKKESSTGNFANKSQLNSPKSSNVAKKTPTIKPKSPKPTKVPKTTIKPRAPKPSVVIKRKK